MEKQSSFTLLLSSLRDDVNDDGQDEKNDSEGTPNIPAANAPKTFKPKYENVMRPDAIRKLQKDKLAQKKKNWKLNNNNKNKNKDSPHHKGTPEEVEEYYWNREKFIAQPAAPPVNNSKKPSFRSQQQPNKNNNNKLPVRSPNIKQWPPQHKADAPRQDVPNKVSVQQSKAADAPREGVPNKPLVVPQSKASEAPRQGGPNRPWVQKNKSDPSRQVLDRNQNRDKARVSQIIATIANESRLKPVEEPEYVSYDQIKHKLAAFNDNQENVTGDYIVVKNSIPTYNLSQVDDDSDDDGLYLDTDVYLESIYNVDPEDGSIRVPLDTTNSSNDTTAGNIPTFSERVFEVRRQVAETLLQLAPDAPPVDVYNAIAGAAVDIMVNPTFDEQQQEQAAALVEPKEMISQVPSNDESGKSGLGSPETDVNDFWQAQLNGLDSEKEMFELLKQKQNELLERIQSNKPLSDATAEQIHQQVFANEEGFLKQSQVFKESLIDPSKLPDAIQLRHSARYKKREEEVLKALDAVVHEVQTGMIARKIAAQEGQSTDPLCPKCNFPMTAEEVKYARRRSEDRYKKVCMVCYGEILLRNSKWPPSTNKDEGDTGVKDKQ